MNKVIFVLHRAPGITPSDFAARWRGERHTAMVKAIPGLKRWVQNHSLPDPTGAEPTYDGIGELWFDSPEGMRTAFASAQFAAAMSDSNTFLDLSRSGMVFVEEIEIL